MNLSTILSPWLALLCLALGIGIAWLQYRKAQGKEGFSKRITWFLAVVRAITIAVVAFFLLEPMVRLLVREVRRPVVVVLHDGSASLLATGDTAFLRDDYAGRLEELAAGLGDDYQVRSFTYGDEVRSGLRFDQIDGHTDMGQALREVYDRFSGPDLGAVIMDGDGIVNRGRDPRLDAARLGVPIYSIALGDTTVRPDLLVNGVEHNRISFLGNEFPVLARIQARHLKGTRSRVVITYDGRELSEQEVVVTSDPWMKEFAFSLKAEKPGLQRYTVAVQSVEGEYTIENNSQDIYIDVLDDRQRILLLGAAPHPDLGALRLALDGAEGYETVLAYASEYTDPVDDLDLIVLHQLPSTNFPIGPLLQRAEQKGIPVLAILGSGTDVTAFNALAAGVRVSGTNRVATTDAQAILNPQFTYFTLYPEQVRAIERFPPLQVPFGTYEVGRAAVSLADQRIGSIRTAYPLIAVVQQSERRMAAICGEGLWRWRIADQRFFGSQERFDRLVHQLVQFLALKADKKRFRLDHLPVFSGNESVVITAELYNAALEPVKDADVSIVLKNADGAEFPYSFRSSGTAYRLDAGRLPAGRYTWQAATEHKGERFSASGEFSVRKLVLERINTVADHGLLADIAASSGGRMVRPDSVASLAAAIRAERTITARSYGHQNFSDLIGVRWIFFALLVLLAAEWALRRRHGSY